MNHLQSDRLFSSFLVRESQKKMSGSSKRRDRSIGVKNEILQTGEKTPDAGTISSSAAAESELNGLTCLSGDKPFFDIILSKSHVKHPVVVPASIVHIFPRVVVPMVLTHGDKVWNMKYDGSDKRHTFDYQGWKRFAADNNLKYKDACIFEVLESSSTIVRLRVVILRHVKDLPPELDFGNTPETAIELD